MKKNKIIYALLAVIIIVGIILGCTIKFNFSLAYANSTRLEIYLGKDYEIKDIEKIAEEVFQNKEFIVQKVETFNDMPAITVWGVSSEQKEKLAEKLNEKYETEIKGEDISEVKLPNYRGRDIMERYFLPIGISAVVILVYVAVRYAKLGWGKMIIKTILGVVIIEAIYLSLIVITRLPVSFYTLPLGIVIAAITLTVMMFKNEKNLELKKNEKKEREVID